MLGVCLACRFVILATVLVTFSRLVLLSTRLRIFLVLLLFALFIGIFGRSFAGDFWDLLAVEIDVQLSFAEEVQGLILHALRNNGP